MLDAMFIYRRDIDFTNFVELMLPNTTQTQLMKRTGKYFPTPGQQSDLRHRLNASRIIAANRKRTPACLIDQ